MKTKTVFAKVQKTFGLLSVTLFMINCTVLAEKENRAITDFTQISYSLPGSLEIVQADKVSLVLEGDQEDLNKIITKVEGDHLKIYAKGSSSGLGDIKVYVSIKELSELSVAGSGDAVVKSALKTEQLELHLSGSGNIQCEELICKELEVNIAGSGDIYVGGEAEEEIELNIAGSGDVKAENLKTSEAEVNIAGSGSAKIWVTDKLETNIVGSGDVYYKGNPLVDAESVGSGSTKSIE